MLLRLTSLLLILLAPLTAQSSSKIVFERQIFPILERNCIECHREPYIDTNGRRKRPKGRVMLDTLANIQKSKRGQLFVAKDTDASLILDSITLPADDEDRMPPAKAGPPLSKRDLDLITKWIEQGADFGQWTGEEDNKTATKKPSSSAAKKPTGKPKASRGVSPIVTLGKGLRPISPAVLKSFEDTNFQVRSVGDDSPLLTVTSCGKTDDVNDAAAAAAYPVTSEMLMTSTASTHMPRSG